MADRFRDGIGMDTEQENAPSEFLMDGGRQGRQVGGIIMSTARDSGSTPTTTLRAGLVMGRITITDLWKEYDDGDSDGTNVARAILVKDVNLLNNAGTAVNSASTTMVRLTCGPSTPLSRRISFPNRGAIRKAQA